MMRGWKAVLCLTALVVLAGCKVFPSFGLTLVPGSLYPMAASESDLVSDPGLMGEWWNGADKPDATGDASASTQTIDKWFLRQGQAPGSYVLGMVSGEESSTWTARLVRNGDALFLDAAPDLESAGDGNSDALTYSVGLHVFLRVTKEKDQLGLAPLSPDWYLRRLEAKQFPLRIERLGSDVPVITSSPEEIRAFYAKAATDPTAFSDDYSLGLTRPWRTQREGGAR